MIIKIVICVISLAAIYYAATFASWLRQNGNTPGAGGVFAFVVAALVLLAARMGL